MGIYEELYRDQQQIEIIIIIQLQRYSLSESFFLEKSGFLECCDEFKTTFI